jgi:hypothetical protein
LMAPQARRYDGGTIFTSCLLSGFLERFILVELVGIELCRSVENM